ncbi:NADP-dependent oxidoreductase [Dellaglioa sp. BT-FLS60]
MKAFGFNQYGDANVFEELQVEPVAELKSKQVRVSVEAIGINPFEAIVRAGYMKDVMPLPFPIVPGGDVTGIITEIGNEVTNYSVGDAVIVHKGVGGYAEELVVFTSHIAKRPANITLAEAAGLPTPGIAAYNILTFFAKARAGETIFIEGASGSVGMILVQLAKLMELTVLASGSSVNEAYVRKLGADQYSAYDKENPADTFKDMADIVVDATLGGRGSDVGVRTLKPNGRMVSLISVPSEEMQKEKPLADYYQVEGLKELKDSDALTFLTDLMMQDELEIKIAKEYKFKLTDIIEAHKQLDLPRTAGKMVVIVKDI